MELAMQPLLELARAKLSRVASCSCSSSSSSSSSSSLDALDLAYAELRELRALLFRSPVATALREAEAAVAAGRSRPSTVWHQMYARSPAALLSPYRALSSTSSSSLAVAADGKGKGKVRSLLLYTARLDALEMRALAAALRRYPPSTAAAEALAAAAARGEESLEFRVAALMLATNAAVNGAPDAIARGDVGPFRRGGTTIMLPAHWLPVEEACWDRVKDSLDAFAQRITVMQGDAARARADEARALYDVFRDGGQRLLAAARRATSASAAGRR